jgi:UDP-2-acetamido-3-amino-2,3-dideoxy-glucuronate N-acetyltransferase
MIQDLFEGGFDDNRAESAYIHESSYVDSPCRIGENTSILHFSHIMPNAIIGDNCHIGHNVTIGSGVIIGNNVRVMNNAMLNSGVILENDVYCGPSAIFAALKHVRAQKGSISAVSPTVVRRGAHIGANTTLATGFTIGQHTFIEAGSVIDRNIPDFALVYGNPLKFVGWRCECGERLKFAQEIAECKSCGKTYTQKSERKVIQLREEDAEVQRSSGLYVSLPSLKQQE